MLCLDLEGPTKAKIMEPCLLSCACHFTSSFQRQMYNITSSILTMGGGSHYWPLSQDEPKPPVDGRESRDRSSRSPPHYVVIDGLTLIERRDVSLWMQQSVFKKIKFTSFSAKSVFVVRTANLEYFHQFTLKKLYTQSRTTNPEKKKKSITFSKQETTTRSIVSSP